MGFRTVLQVALHATAAVTILGVSADFSHAQQSTPATFESMVAEIKKVAVVSSPEQFSGQLQVGQLFLAPSERVLQSLLGTSFPTAFTLGVAQRREALSPGAKVVALRELQKLQSVTQSQGGQWILKIIKILQSDASCQPGVWSDGLSPLVQIPEAREVIQDYLASQLSTFAVGRRLTIGCQQRRTPAGSEQRFATDFFLLFLKTEPDPFEALSLYRQLLSRVTNKPLRAALTLSISSYVETRLPPLPQEK